VGARSRAPEESEVGGAVAVGGPAGGIRALRGGPGTGRIGSEPADVTGSRSRVVDATRATRAQRERPIDSSGSCTLSQRDTSKSSSKRAATPRRHSYGSGSRPVNGGESGCCWNPQTLPASG
jgi:hypothetical protein